MRSARTALAALFLLPALAAEAARDPRDLGRRSTIQDCAATDWRALGLYDGRRGRPQPQRYVVIARVCEGHGITPRQDEYFRGYAEGFDTIRR